MPKGFISPFLIILIVVLAVTSAYFFLLLPKKETLNLHQMSDVDHKKKMHKVAVLIGQDAHAPAFLGFKEKMTQLGYIEGSNISYQVLNGKGDAKLVEKYAEELVSQNPEIIVTSSTSATKPVIKLTKQIPIVFLASGNVEELVEHQPFSGTNVTGIASAETDITGKRLESLLQLKPDMKRVGLVYNPTTNAYKKAYNLAYDAAPKIGLQLIDIPVASIEESTKTSPTLAQKKLDAILLLPTGGITTIAEPLVKSATQQKILSSCATEEAIKNGCMTGLVSNLKSMGVQGASMVDRIFQGMKPSEIAIENALTSNFVINLNTVKSMNLKIAQTVLESADKLIE